MDIFDTVIVENFRQTSDKYSCRKAAEQLLKRVGVKVKLKSKKTIPSGPTLIISNHDGGLDSMVVQAVVGRKDLYHVAIYPYKIMGRKLEKRLLPIYRKRFLDQLLVNRLLKRIKEPVLKIKDTEIKKRNRQTVANAAKVISQGQAVMVFPQGHSGKAITENNWRAGVGFLLKQITNPKTKIVFAQIDNSVRIDLLRYLNPTLRKIFFNQKTMEIKFASPIKLSSIKNWPRKDGKELARLLEKKYYQVFPQG